MMNEMVSRLIEEDNEDESVSGISSLVQQNLSLKVDKNEPSTLLTSHWSTSQSIQLVNQGTPSQK